MGRAHAILILGCLVLGSLPACGLGDEVFVAGAEYDPCMATVGVCQTAAGCNMGETVYIEGDFPGFRNFVVKTLLADTTLVVKVFFKTRKHPGEDTEITWFEPGCNDFYRYESFGEDIFAEAGTDQVFQKEQKLRQAGPHLVEIYSDAWAHYLLRVELKEPL
jgi:hypothetical protein